MKVIKTESENGIVSSVQIETENNLKIWFDIWLDNNELTGDWNMYIFDLKNSKDLEIKKFQENIENFNECLDLAIYEYERQK
jgi:hypothetical protein